MKNHSNRSFHVSEASTNKSTKTDFTKPVPSRHHRNRSVLDIVPNKDEFNRSFSSERTEKFNEFYKRTYETSFNKEESYGKVMQKRKFEKIIKQNPKIAQDSLKLEKLYEGSKVYSDNKVNKKNNYVNSTAEWNIKNYNSINKINRESKNKYLNDMINTNPMKILNNEERIKNNKDMRRRSLGKCQSVSDYLGSTQLKNIIFPKQTSIIENIKNSTKITNSVLNKESVLNSNLIKPKTAIKFRHLFDKNRGFFL